MRIQKFGVLIAFLAVTGNAHADLVGVDLTAREDVANGSTFGAVGAYEKLSGTLHFAVDPGATANHAIADIELAPRNAAGLVEFDADFFLLKPKQLERGNQTLLFEVSNRGGKGILSMFNRAAGSLNPGTPEEFGDGFMLAEGYSILWVGWQFDPPDREHVLRVRPPIALRDGTPVEGLVRSDFVVRQPVSHHNLADRNHKAYPVADKDHADNRLTVRDMPLGARTVIPRSEWRFARMDGNRLVASNMDVYLDGGFEPNKIYELVYRGTDAVLAGLGLAAIRDAVSHIKHNGVEALDIGGDDIQHALAFGISQSGRLLRTFLYDGFNADETDRRVFDGVIAHIAGGARGSFNHRFAQASRASWSYLYPNAQFPFSDGEQTDPATGRVDGLLSGIAVEHMPRILYTNSSNEYWRGTAALTHTSIDGQRDLPELENVRSYQFAGTQHVAVGFPPRRTTGQQAGNPNSYSWFLRGLLTALEDWVRKDTPPPPSRHPTRAAETLVPFSEFEYPHIEQLAVPTILNAAVALDFGPQFRQRGVISLEPPRVGMAYPILVPRVDADGNEIDGLRSPLQAVPLATFTGWNLFAAEFGPPSELVALQGSFVPFPANARAAQAAGDPRRPISERYSSRDNYLQLVREEASKLATQRYLLPADVEGIVSEASRYWDHLAER